MMKNIFAFDIDGTLMKFSSPKIDQYAEMSIKEAKKLGEVVLASARPYRGITSLYNSNLSIDHIVALNGAHIISRNKEKMVPIPTEIAKILISQRYNYPNFWIYTKKGWYADNISTPECKKEIHGVNFEPYSFAEYENDEILKILIVLNENIQETIEKIRNISNDITVVTSSDTFIEIFSSKINKFKAIQSLYTGEARIYSFGDSNNDEEMIKNSFWGSAVNNATDNVKSSAKYISKYKYGQGVYDAMHIIKSKFF